MMSYLEVKCDNCGVTVANGNIVMHQGKQLCSTCYQRAWEKDMNNNGPVSEQKPVARTAETAPPVQAADIPLAPEPVSTQPPMVGNTEVAGGVHHYQSQGGAYVNQPNLVETMIPSKNGPALLGYYMGFAALLPIPLIGLGCAIVSMVASIKGIQRANRYPEVRGRNHAIVGVCLASLGILMQISCLGSILLAIFARTSHP